MRILITGIGGSGKTTLISQLSARGKNTIDLDDTDLCAWFNKETGMKEKYKEGAGSAWLDNHSFRTDLIGLQALLDSFSNDRDVYVGGKIASSQIREAMMFFDRAFLLKPSDRVLTHRQSSRTNKANNFAKSSEEQNHLLEGRKKFEAICIDNGIIPLNADSSIEELLAQIL